MKYLTANALSLALLCACVWALHTDKEAWAGAFLLFSLFTAVGPSGSKDDG